MGGSEPDDRELAAALRNAGDAVVVSDAGGVIRFWNTAAERLFGWPEAQAVGRTLDLIIPHRFRDRHWQAYREAMDTGHVSSAGRLLEVPALRVDGSVFSIAFTVALIRDHAGAASIVAVVRDDTERRSQRRWLEERIAALEAGMAP